MSAPSFGKYIVTKRLGRGGMAEVYLAHDPTLDRNVAIKVIHAHLASEPGFAERFTREAKLVASLRHAHIVQLHDFDVLNDQPFMVMEYLDGGTLHDRLKAFRVCGKTMSLDEAAHILEQIASALDYAHERGVVHRDVKPANILFTSRGEPVLTDFGISKIIGDIAKLSASGTTIGSPAYMSPEQATSKPVDARSDLYSLGVVVYEMVTGRVPFQGETPAAVLMQHIADVPPPPRQFNPSLPELAQVVILKALAKDPNDRFESVGELARSFKAALRGEALTPKRVVALGAPTVADESSAKTLVPPATFARKTATQPGWLAHPGVVGVLVVMLAVVMVGIIAGGLAISRFLPLTVSLEQPTRFVNATLTITPRLAQTLKPSLAPTMVQPTPILPAPRPNGTLILQDDFDSENAHPLFGTQFMTFKQSDGEAHLTGINPKHVLPAMYSSPKSRDFFSEFDFRPESPASDSGYGLIFRSDDAAGGLDWYYIVAIYPGTENVRFQCWKDNSWVMGKNYPVPSGLIQRSPANHLRVEAIGNEFRVFLNGIFVFQATDATLTNSGIFGLATITGSLVPDTVHFGNLRIYASSSP